MMRLHGSITYLCRKGDAMKNMEIEARILEAMARQEPKTPRVNELGGGFYYKCHWITCDTDINRFMEYCPKCGQKIDWSDK